MDIKKEVVISSKEDYDYFNIVYQALQGLSSCRRLSSEEWNYFIKLREVLNSIDITD